VSDRDRVPVLLGIIALLLGVSFLQNHVTFQIASSPSKTMLSGEKIDPFEVSIQGSIVDNFVNVNYQMLYDNYASSNAREIEWFLGLQTGLRLSNISVVLNGETYWGRVLPELQAVETYEESVEANKSAVLVLRTDDGYNIQMNVEGGAAATLTIFVEGLLTRKSGLYTLDLPVGRAGIEDTKFSFDLEVRSNFEPVAGYSVRGLPSLQVTDLANGIRLQYPTTQLTIEELIEITYILDRQMGGAQLLTYNNGSDNFFVYLLAPCIVEDVETARRQFVFVLDKSGSMSGTKIDQAKTAFSTMIGGLRSIDTFNVISFNDNIRALWDEPHSGATENIQAAQDWIDSIAAGGSTNFHGAALSGLGTFTEGANAKAMLMLSDGLPTAGELTLPRAILSAINAANTLDVSIATVAFGSDADENLMANIASQNSGFFVFIEPNQDASTELLDFYSTFSTPVADNYDIDFSGASEVATLSPLGDSAFFNGTEIVVSGRYTEGMTVTTSISYVTGTETYVDTIGSATQEFQHVELIWAQQRINYLLHLIQLNGESEVLRNQIIRLGMLYGIAVEGFTAIVLTAYDASSVNENTDGATYTNTPPATYSYGNPPATAASPPPGAAFDPALGVGAEGVVFSMILLVGIVLLISRSRRG
jgi:hypothetical protein